MTFDPLTSRYLAASEAGSFWHWDSESEDPALDAVVWGDESTIAFRSEIRAVLEALAPEGLPPFDAVVLLLAACRGNWANCRGQLLKAAADAEELQQGSLLLLGQLDIVQSLPSSLRKSVEAKTVLARIVFEGRGQRGTPEAAAQILNGFDQFDPYEPVPKALVPPRSRIDHSKLRTLFRSLARIDASTLRLRVQTGLDELVKAANLVIPVADRARQLLTELDDDSEWQGLARLTRRLMAAISLPHPVSDLEDLPLGGISDITNRGQLDRLLLSELAQDDLMFTARLATSELLYLRHETPPRPQAEMRSLLLDCGLRLWGVPRIFATSVALAFLATSRKAGDCKVFRAAGAEVEPVDLLTRDGLTAHLGVLRPSMHPGEALPAFLAVNEAKSQSITPILVTAQQTLRDPEFRDALREHATQGLYVATVSREGHFQLSWMAQHERRLQSEAKLTLDEILQADRPTRQPRVRLLDPVLPRILQTDPFPLRVPYPMSLAVSATAVDDKWLLVVTHDRRLLRCDDGSDFPVQLAACLPPGRVRWLRPDSSPHLVRAVILAPPHSDSTLLEVDVEQGECRLQTLAGDGRRAPVGAALHQGAVFLVGPSWVEAFSLLGHCIGQSQIPESLKYVPPGRFFRHRTQQKWYALSLQGTEVHLQEVTCAIGQPMPELIQLIDVAGREGPVGVNEYGDAFDTVSGQWSGASDGSPKTTKLNRRDRHKTVALSRCGRHAAVRVISTNSQNRSRNWYRHVESGWLGQMLWPVRPQVMLELLALLINKGCIDVGKKSPIDQTCATGFPPSLSLPNPFTEVTVRGGGKIELTAQSRQVFRMDGSLTWTQSSGHLSFLQSSKRDSRRAVFTTVKTSSCRQNVQLQVAEFSDGSRICVDSLGLLHLVSAASELPEVSLVLPHRGKCALSGWCSNDQWFGDRKFYIAPVDCVCSAQSVYDQVIVPFVRHILCPPGH